VTVTRFEGTHAPVEGLLHGAHAHDFLVLSLVDRGAGQLCLDGRWWEVTTVVGRRTGRTVQQWITERRLAEARRLLAQTDLTVQAVAGRVGYADAGYLIRRFHAAHGVPPPQEWRGAGRSP
jgi:Helix-turn-helix domain